MTDKTLNRSKQISLLADALSKNSCVITGGRRWGKTTLAKQYVAQTKKSTVWLDAKRLAICPERFCLQVIGTVLHTQDNAPASQLLNYQTRSFISSYTLSTTPKNAVLTIDNELQKIKPDHVLLLQQLHAFLRSFSLLVVIDNAEYLLDFHNFSSISSCASFFASTDSLKFLFITSLSTEFCKTFRTIDVVPVPLLSKKETEKLCSSYNKPSDWLYALTQGHPYALHSLLKASVASKHESLAYLLSSSSSLHEYCDSALSFYQQHARGQSLTKALLPLLVEKPRRLSELARELYRSAPVTKSVLQRLIDVDLVVKQGKTFSLSDPLLAQWLKLISQGYEDASAKELQEVDQ